MTPGQAILYLMLVMVQLLINQSSLCVLMDSKTNSWRLTTCNHKYRFLCNDCNGKITKYAFCMVQSSPTTTSRPTTQLFADNLESNSGSEEMKRR